MTTPQTVQSSPRWGSTTKLVVALTIVAVAAALLVRFQFIIGPLLIALVLAYLLHPVATLLQRRPLSWRAAVSVVYLVIFILLIGLLALGGLGLLQQVQSVVQLAQDGLRALPDAISQFSGRVYQFGPFRIDFRTLDLNEISRQVLGQIQPLLSRTGTLISRVAGSAASFLGWTFFVLLVSYFVLVESGGRRGRIVDVRIPGYRSDIERLGRELARTWNAFLRGQIIIFFLAVTVYTILLTLLGVRYAIALALLAGLARFVPYVGPLINWLALFLVSYFQEFKLFDMSPFAYALLVVGLALVVDQIFDSLVSPRILSQALKVHPAGVLVSAIICANLLGLLGVVIAAPMLATATIFWRYAVRKLQDLDPWPEEEPSLPPPPPGSRFLIPARRLWRRFTQPRTKTE
ncbi:MAG TPA: AI-2E family transporter [Anaerolineales bacterium]